MVITWSVFCLHFDILERSEPLAPLSIVSVNVNTPATQIKFPAAPPCFEVTFMLILWIMKGKYILFQVTISKMYFCTNFTFIPGETLQIWMCSWFGGKTAQEGGDEDCTGALGGLVLFVTDTEAAANCFQHLPQLVSTTTLLGFRMIKKAEQ